MASIYTKNKSIFELTARFVVLKATPSLSRKQNNEFKAIKKELLSHVTFRKGK